MLHHVLHYESYSFMAPWLLTRPVRLASLVPHAPRYACGHVSGESGQVLLDAVQKLQVWGEELFAAVLDDSEAPSRKRTRTRQPRV